MSIHSTLWILKIVKMVFESVNKRLQLTKLDVKSLNNVLKCSKTTYVFHLSPKLFLELTFLILTGDENMKKKCNKKC